MDVLETTKFQSKMEHTNSDVEEYFASVKETSLNISDEKIKVTKLQDDLLENSNDSFSSENSSVYASPMANVEDTESGMETEAEVANERLNETNIKPFGHEKPFNPNQGKILAAMLKEIDKKLVDKNNETVINSENLTSSQPEQNCEEYRNAKNKNPLRLLATCPTELVQEDKSRNSDEQSVIECINEMPVLKENKISLNAKSKNELKESVAISGSSGSLVISTGTSTATNSLANLSTTATGLTDSATILISTANSIT
uniref:Uncharacterized protein n=1 Tax=Ciona savignyi TaxID=51511 RepID=H2Z2B9_CIOSA